MQHLSASDWRAILTVIAFALIILAVILSLPVGYSVQSHWQHYFNNFKFSAEDFYVKVKEKLEEHKISGVEFERKNLNESGFLSGKREYLRISWQEYIFFVNASEFGKGSFMSWWLCIKDRKLIEKVPLLNKLAGKKRDSKTFYQMDTEARFKAIVHDVILEVVEEITSVQGIRLTELEKQITDRVK